MEGFHPLVTLWIAIISAELFNQFEHFSALDQDHRDMRIGFGVGGFMIFLLMLFFGDYGWARVRALRRGCTTTS